MSSWIREKLWISSIAAPAGTAGGGILNRANLTLNDVVVADSKAKAAGGGIANILGNVTVKGGGVAFNAAGSFGGGILSFFFLAAMGHGLHLLLDMEENTRLTAQALVQIARRQGGG